ncbi:hypothetical protein HELRODRAFT_105249 [Helobdella robusta]|uniref:Cysteine protease n=1 Tax=Helobdella robusta TaxID=6412 RepID=T1EDS2_HELRO|nr:hypothetical protein HELRODRAFT_105249 [Helobdella robusta]ESO12244.1 hypothetical protein HELRODRAFT_105249 [Helobdella robusta]
MQSLVSFFLDKIVFECSFHIFKIKLYLFLIATVLQSSYEDFLEESGFPLTNEPVWFLGKQYIVPAEKTILEEDVLTRFWFTYRKGFTAIGGTGPTTDQGWGCMLRCGQMMVAHSLVCRHLDRDWKWCHKKTTSKHMQMQARYKYQQQIYTKILKLFLDERDSYYSVQQITSMGASEGKNVGEWFGPNTIAHVLKKVCCYDIWSNIVIHVSMDNTVVISDIVEQCKVGFSDRTPENTDSDYNRSSWRPLLLIIPLRLGVSEINIAYYDQLKACLRLKQSAGVLGGRPNHAFWIVGYTENYFFYFDPHTTQQAVKSSQPASSLHETYHLKYPSSHIHIKDLDPSIATGFFCQTEEDFTNLCSNFRENIIKTSISPMFELLQTRPAHFTEYEPNVQEGKSVEDFEQLKYEEDFEIL